MNALALIQDGMIRALTPAGKPKQDIRPVVSSYGGTNIFGGPAKPMHIVEVAGEYYRVDDRELALLNTGMSPDDLDLTPGADSFGEDE